MALHNRAVSNLARRLSLAAACMVVSLGAQATTITLSANSHNSYGAQYNSSYNDTVGRAYHNPNPFDAYTAIGFDFSSLPDLANITAMTLTVSATNVWNAPVVQVNRSNFDGYTTTTGGSSITFNELLGQASPTATGSVTFTLDPTAVNWTNDLQDNKLTLVLSNLSTAYSYLYFGLEGANAPKLTVSYSQGTAVPEPSSVALVILGLALVGGVARRSRG